MPESNTQTNCPPEPVPEPEPEPLSVDVARHCDVPLTDDRIRNVVKTILRDYEWQHGEISIAIVDDPTIHQLNRDYLQHDYETDVLSFVLDSDMGGRKLDGEIIVSADTAIRMAEERDINGMDELMLYIIHGTLHLAGLDDKDAQRRLEMRAAEKRYTSQFQIDYCPPDDPDVVGGLS